MFLYVNVDLIADTIDRRRLPRVRLTFVYFFSASRGDTHPERFGSYHRISTSLDTDRHARGALLHWFTCHVSRLFSTAARTDSRASTRSVTRPERASKRLRRQELAINVDQGRQGRRSFAKTASVLITGLRTRGSDHDWYILLRDKNFTRDIEVT
ncbi:uncharacterized protein LOC143182073 [Calliopsis andreniformis]|uniref:uncharacterized protein LOC143182073 n=1 Tax=Calliopsis andreniformis TaxID=337506 RepID=UPI003FCD7547